MEAEDERPQKAHLAFPPGHCRYPIAGLGATETNFEACAALTDNETGSQHLFRIGNSPENENRQARIRRMT